MAQSKPTGDEQAEFEARYVSANIRPGAPGFSSELVTSLRKRLLSFGEDEWKYYSYAVLAAVFVGTHRGDCASKLFEEAIEGTTDIEEIKAIFYKIRECITVIWPFVGIPWTVPAGLGIVNVLQRRNIEFIGAQKVRGDLDAGVHLEEGKAMIARTYEKVNNPEVRELLSIGFPEMRLATNTVVWGYSVAGANKSGVLAEHQTQLLIATAITASGSTRQARSHLKASLAMGNGEGVVTEVAKICTEVAEWAGNPLPHPLDVGALSNQLKA
ncbi:hypothetical protein P152DRAFT_482052 [Eremomyces bilateralis CBS 781.70]|uniref:Uncharacterized protein n=1 Tax=Eremomyces bilateralis CBS 781.70 TaxID=1392243 RepID=A0A6G1G3G7_9PEZI|nr:uncharacterized protein P152DRAFT_482052 [Eremomyces bilateralis CBS 781.70]KAF1812558.1 hypothetical protein P152DRAFT_482052 [Eremomyces bilateralis CBS 781.70]